MKRVEPILDESTLGPSTTHSPEARIEVLAETLKAFDAVGAARVLRSVRDAADRDLQAGRGLRSWCFSGSTPKAKDAGRFVAVRLDRQPFIDGADGLFAAAEDRRAVEARLQGVPVVGLGFAALTEGFVVALTTDVRTTGGPLTVDVTILDDDGTREERIDVQVFTSAREVSGAREELVQQVDRAVPDGPSIIARLTELFPRLRLGDDAQKPIAALTGRETVFRQLVRHLRALDEGARIWDKGSYAPLAVSFSVESEATLTHGTYGPMRDFSVPAGFRCERWSLHTKLTGGAGARLYFRAERADGQPLVLVGYFGNHLPTVRYD